MKKEIADQWVAALRSGEYSQATAALKTKDGFCCLGVLCDLHAKTFNNEWHYDDEDEYEYLNGAFLLPTEVMKWAQLKDDAGKFGALNIDGSVESLVNLNDNGKSFAEIADVIEKYWKEL